MSTMRMERPNIIFILSDDQGAWALGCAGNDEIRTPRLDELAQDGMRFSNFFCTSPVCSPARASLLTGRIPSQHGVHDWIKEGNVGELSVEYLQGQTAYTEFLAEIGYICGLSGKWHLGASLRPQKGFSHWYVHQTGGSSYYNAPMIKNGMLMNEPKYITEAITDEAIGFLDSWNAEKPFYLGVHYTAPHSPWTGNHPQELIDSYKDCHFRTCPQEPTHPWICRPVPEAGKRRDSLKGYYAAVTAMDREIGRILDRLDQMGIRDNTLVCFMSDNGFNCGHHGIWGKGNATFPQNMYDSSVKISAIFRHPVKIPPGRVCDELVSGYDVMPTLLEYVGLSGKIDGNLPGTSFMPLLRGESAHQSNHIVVYDEYGPVRMIRTKKWKYVHRYPYGPHELYDLKIDPEERVNLIDDSEMQERVATMKAEMDSWFVRYADPALDGSREAVTGFGQLGPAGPTGGGQLAYDSRRHSLNDTKNGLERY